jgi:HAD superfamily hydrolase (TIGR01549 family)
MKNIKAILFDLDGTLRHHAPTGGDVFFQFVKGVPFDYSEADRIRTEHWEYSYFANSPEIQEDQMVFKNDLNAFWVNFAKRKLLMLGMLETQASEYAPQLSHYMKEHYKPDVVVPSEIPNVLTLLQEAGYILGVVSNRETPFQDELKNMKIDSFFNFSLAAGEVGSFKPDALIFEKSLEIAGVSASEAIYVGDNYFADIVGSSNAGLFPVLYDPSGLFPDAECKIITSFNQLHDVLNELR